MDQIKATVVCVLLLAVSLLLVDCSPVNITVVINGDKATQEFHTVAVFNSKTGNDVKIHADFLQFGSDSTGKVENNLTKNLPNNVTVTIRAPKTGVLVVKYTIKSGDKGSDESDARNLFDSSQDVGKKCYTLLRDERDPEHPAVDCSTLPESSYFITYL